MMDQCEIGLNVLLLCIYAHLRVMELAGRMIQMFVVEPKRTTLLLWYSDKSIPLHKKGFSTTELANWATQSHVQHSVCILKIHTGKTHCFLFSIFFLFLFSFSFFIKCANFLKFLIFYF